MKVLGCFENVRDVGNTPCKYQQCVPLVGMSSRKCNTVEDVLPNILYKYVFKYVLFKN